jgi:hypothetical protein
MKYDKNNFWSNMLRNVISVTVLLFYLLFDREVCGVVAYSKFRLK